MAKIVPINQELIDSIKDTLALLDESFLGMSFEERAEKYQSFMKVKQMTEEMLKSAQERYAHAQHEDINEQKV
jgi:hypothetical protein